MFCRTSSNNRAVSKRVTNNFFLLFPGEFKPASVIWGSTKKTPEQIHANMSHVRCKDTRIEVMLRRELWKRGLRYRKNVREITGTPDIVFIGRRVAVFCDSEFWHGYDWDNQKCTIKSNVDFWTRKIERKQILFFFCYNKWILSI